MSGRGGPRQGAGRPRKNDSKLKKIFNRSVGLAKLDKIGAAEEKRIVALLAEEGLLHRLDAALIRCYALAFQEWNAAEKALQEQGIIIENSSGNPVTSPWLRVRDGAHKRMIDAVRELGLSPKARSKLIPAEKIVEEDEMDSLIQQDV
ncbi:phage terminase small subunit P27 family [Hydrogenimonas urashimensis]|uniref:phage terminase small subunit P27 family n=1 Tax=Hydrogenimonas urashimensis TaxID=2740515 RepID=UPI0019165AB8|nr:phage terminase small subunit P27 family [Hydrogenimonas urashimensis]